MKANSPNVSPGTIHRLTAAEGYLELNMPEHALAELAEIAAAGPYQPAVDLMTGEALKVQERYGDAIEPLQRAAERIPAPHSRRAWLALSECLRQEGRDELAEVAAARARAAAGRRSRKRGGTFKISVSFEPAEPSEGDDDFAGDDETV